MFWDPATHIQWHYRRPTWQPGMAEVVRPMTVVRDDDDGLVAWLAPGTTVVEPVLLDGSEIRSAPLDQRFRLERRSHRRPWVGQGVLKLAPAGVPWSVWLFWSDDWAHRGWYVNLEDVHTRDTAGVYTLDHVLDVWVAADRTVHWKDVDELEAAVDAGRFTQAEADGFRATAAHVHALADAWASPFGDGWESWRPDPSWTVPQLP
jgi:hypothetical protein